METGESQSTPENTSERWSSEQFVRYLTQIPHVKTRELESLENFPKRIELNGEWHNTLNKMRQETNEDGRERWTVVGLRKRGKRTFDVHIPTEFSLGSENEITKDAYQDGLTKAEQSGIFYFVGRIHSHPEWSKTFIERYRYTKRFISEYKGFSPGDFFPMVKPWEGTFLDTVYRVHGLVDSSTNYFAFITRNTEYLLPNSELSNIKNFMDYWFYQRTRSTRHSKIPITLPKMFSLWNVNLAIAEHYKLALFRGKPGEDLIRAFP